jgi:hypothetical protein
VFILRPKTAFGFVDEDNEFSLSSTRWTFD